MSDPTRLDPYITTALARFARQSPVLVALDFDGCLAPLVADPAQARPLPAAAAALTDLGRDDGVELALVSGRPAADLVTLADPPPGTWLIGSHGAERAQLDGTGTLELDPFQLTPQEQTRLAEVTAALEQIAADYPGTWVERKPAAAVLHTRTIGTSGSAGPAGSAGSGGSAESGAPAGSAEAAAAAALAGPGHSDGVHPMHGDHVVELAVVPATKGAALAKLRSELDQRRGTALPVLYAGDDVTDETALATLAFSDVGIKVGSATTVARYRVPDPAGVAAALRWLVHHR